MSNWLADFAAAHPGITIDLVVSDVRVDLVREGIDRALRAGHLNEWTFSLTHDSGGEPLVVKVRGPLTCHSASIAHEWALQERGIIYISELALGRSLASGALVRLLQYYLGKRLGMAP